MADEPSIRLGDFLKGIVSKRTKTLDYAKDALVKGENCILAEGGIVTRPGSSVAHNATNLVVTLRALWQTVFPTNEITYLIAQISGTTTVEWVADVVGPDRHSHSLVYDAENDRDILFGGTNALAIYKNDVWARNRTTGAWTELSPTGTPPSARHGHTAHYRAADGCMYVLYGKDVTGPKNDVFKLDLTLGAEAWSQVTTSGTAPTARYDHASCLIGTGTIMLCGGHGAAGGNTLNFLTYYDLNCSTGAWTEIVGTAEGFPNSRSGHTVVYDGTQYAYVVGGNVNDEFYTATTYKLNRTTGAWTALTNVPSQGDTGLAYHCSLYCSGYVVCVAGSGVVAGADNAQYQVLNVALGTWASITPDGDIAPRREAAMATDSDGNTVLHGGRTNEDPDVILDTVFVAADLCSAAAGTGIVLVYGLYASNTHLPSGALFFEAVKLLTADSGVCTHATLGDREIITEGITDVPHVFLPGTLSTDPVGSWAQPMRVLVTYDGSTYHDVSDKVLDNDLDSIADIGGITTRGAIILILDVPTWYGLYAEFGQVNTLAGSTTEFSEVARLDGITDIEREDIKGEIVRWVKDAAGTGHFEGVERNPVGAAVDLGGAPNTVKIPCVGHGFVAADVIEMRDTLYDGTHTLGSQAAGDADNFIIESAYFAEVFAAPDSARKRMTLGLGNDAPFVQAGAEVTFSDAAVVTIPSVTGDGEADNEVAISTDHATDTVTIAGIMVNEAEVVTVGAAQADSATDLVSPAFASGYGFLKNQGSFRQVIKGADLAADKAFVRFKFVVSTTFARVKEAHILSASIVQRSGSTEDGTTTPTPITFSNGAAGVDIVYDGSTPETLYAWSDWIAYSIDNANDYLITFDLMTGTGSMADATQGRPISNFSSLNWVTKPFGDTHVCYELSASPAYNQQNVTASRQTYGIAGIREIQGMDSLTAISDLHVGVTNNTSQLDMSGYESIKQISATETTPGNSVGYYALSVDQRNTWIIHNGTVIRTIAKLESATWRYQNAADAWIDTGLATPYEALRLAFAIAQNQMDGTAMAARTEAQWASTSGYPTLDFAFGLLADSENVPTLTEFTVKVYDSGGAETSIWSGGAWTQIAVTDNTSAGGVSFGQNGTIIPTAGSATTNYAVIAGIPGYPVKINCRGTAVGTTLTKVRYRAPCQPLQNIGSGQPVAPMVVFHDVSAGKILDYSIQLADETYTELASAVIPLETADALYVGYLTPFTEIELIMFEDNNDNISSLIVKYWNGTAWTTLAVIDGTSTDGKTLRQRGKIKFAVPSDWKSNIPLEGLTDTDSGGRTEIMYWLQLSVSANVTSTATIAEARVQPVPTPLVKYKHVAAFQSRIALASRADAPDQIAISQAFLEYVWNGPYAANYRLGGGVVTSLLSAWNTLLAGQVDRSVLISQVSGQDSDMVPVEAARHVPINRQSIVSAPMAGADDGSRSGLFFLNRYGCYAETGLQSDPNFASARFQVLSDGVNWWDAKAVPRLDLNYLHLACGEYWPERNWIVWAVPMILDHGVDPDEAVIQSTTKVKVKATGHGRTAGDVITFTGTKNYRGQVTLHADTDATYLVFTHSYTAEMMTRMCRYSVAGETQTTNNVLIVFDLSIGAWLPWFTIPVASLCTAYEYNTGSPGKLGSLELLAGNYSGQILKLFGTDTDDSGTNIEGYAETGWLNFGEPDSYETLTKFWAYGATTGAAYLTIGRRWMEGTGSTRSTYEDYRTVELTGIVNPIGEIGIHVNDPNVKGNLFKFRWDWTGPTEIRATQPIIPKDTDGGKYR